MAYLDIIVPHYREPWETGKKFFDMLGLQRGIRFDDIRVLLVQDGPEGALPGDIFDDYPYRVLTVMIPHGGEYPVSSTAALKNALPEDSFLVLSAPSARHGSRSSARTDPPSLSVRTTAEYDPSARSSRLTRAVRRGSSSSRNFSPGKKVIAIVCI